MRNGVSSSILLKKIVLSDKKFTEEPKNSKLSLKNEIILILSKIKNFASMKRRMDFLNRTSVFLFIKVKFLITLFFSFLLYFTLLFKNYL